MRIEKFGATEQIGNVEIKEIAGSNSAVLCVGEITDESSAVGTLGVNVFNTKIPVNSSFIIYLHGQTKGVMIGYKYQVEGYGNFLLMAYGGLFNHYWFENGVLKGKEY